MNESIIATVEKLIDVCEEGEEGYSAASREVQDPSLKLLLESYSFQRRTFAERLKREVPEAASETPVRREHPVHHHWSEARGWPALKRNSELTDDAAVLAECEWGEESALNAYRDALANDDLPDELKDLISSQLTEICAAQNWVGDTHDSLSPGAVVAVF